MTFQAFLSLPLLLPVLSPFQEEGVPRSPEVTLAELEAHVRYLASDELRGRRVGTPELNEAARYLAKEFESYGLEPAGDDGSFLQEMFFAVASYDAFPELALIEEGGERREVEYSVDFRVKRPGPSGEFQLALVREEDDLPAEQGKHVALCFPDMSYGQARRWLRDHEAEEGEAFGCLITFTKRSGDPPTSLPRSSRPRLWDGEPVVETTPWLEVGPAYHEWLQAGSAKKVVVDLHYRSELVPTYNVIGRLSPEFIAGNGGLAAEAIVVSAHYDHIGVRSDERAPVPRDGGEPDLINNGADDDASGVACVLELAQKFAAEGPQAREVLFLLATAEEVGIVGTEYYIDHPSTPLDRTVANLNFEMIGRPDEKAGGVGRLWLSGHDRTTLMKTYGEQGIRITADPYPQQNFFERSDNIVFCRRGIVGQTFSSYNLHKDYHQVTDEADTLDFEHLELATQAGYEAVRLVADGTITPAWLEGMKPKMRGER